MKQQRGKSEMPSIVSAGLTIVGDLASDGDIQIEGSIEGDVRSRSVIIGPGGTVKGGVVADNVQISGTVTGSVEAKEITIANNATVSGKIAHKTLSIEAGARVEGELRFLSDAGAAKKSEATVEPVKQPLREVGSGSEVAEPAERSAGRG